MLQAIPTSRMGLKSAHNVDDYNILVQLLKLIWYFLYLRKLFSTGAINVFIFSYLSILNSKLKDAESGTRYAKGYCESHEIERVAKA